MKNPNFLSGNWLYRSFKNDPNPDNEPQLFGQGVLNIFESEAGIIKGSFDFGKWGRMNVSGSILLDSPYKLSFKGVGDPNTAAKEWVYDYRGLYLCKWKHGVDEVDTITGTVIRSKDHGNAKAGVTASFIMIKQ